MFDWLSNFLFGLFELDVMVYPLAALAFLAALSLAKFMITGKRL